MQLICETLFLPRTSETITLLTYRPSSYTSQSIAVVTGDNSYFHSSLLIYCTSVAWPHVRSNAPTFNRLHDFKAPPFLNWFASGFHQNYLLFKSYKVSYNRKCPTLPAQLRNSQSKPLKLGRGLRPFLGRGTGSPSNTNSPGLRPTTMPSISFIHPAVWSQ